MCYTGICKYEHHYTGECSGCMYKEDALCNQKEESKKKIVVPDSKKVVKVRK